jgi:DNA repair ATPase RecN
MEKEEIRMKGLTPEKLLDELMLGKSIKQVMVEHGIPQGSSGQLIKKWGIRKQVDEILASRKAVKQEAAEGPKYEQPEQVRQSDQQADELEQLQKELAEKTERISALKNEIHRMEDEAGYWMAEAERLNKEVEQLRKQLATAEAYTEAYTQTVDQLREERDALLQTVERAVTDHDPINHPAHYTAGKVECIDAIESATIGLTGGLAYCTGAAIKYLWRWSRKNGVEDLHKARWYVDRLIQLASEKDETA